MQRLVEGGQELRREVAIVRGEQAPGQDQHHCPFAPEGPGKGPEAGEVIRQKMVGRAGHPAEEVPQS